jgi:hypothetical protein
LSLPPASARPPRRSLADLGRELTERTGCVVELLLNSNRHTLISFRRKAARRGDRRVMHLRVSIHHSFLVAEDKVLAAVALFLRGQETRQSRAILRQYLDNPPPDEHVRDEGGGAAGLGREQGRRREGGAGRQRATWSSEEASRRATTGPVQLDLFGAVTASHEASLAPPIPPTAAPPAADALSDRPAARRSRYHNRLPTPPPGLQPRGECHDLRVIADVINYAYFDGECPVHITWGSDGARRGGGRRRSILFGTYSSRDHLVRVHPRLDREDIPAFFVEYIVYHEMLHKMVPPVMMPSGRRLVHSREFRRRERLFPRYREALQFERRFVREML